MRKKERVDVLLWRYNGLRRKLVAKGYQITPYRMMDRPRKIICRISQIIWAAYIGHTLITSPVLKCIYEGQATRDSYVRLVFGVLMWMVVHMCIDLAISSRIFELKRPEEKFLPASRWLARTELISGIEMMQAMEREERQTR